ncbi:protein FAM167B-like [Haliotis rubra]|uniref:protein FAM167B-like n=1 Tax=Haliotis rubra TaxID=36100 RepID=UPI001EE502D5|nr:protein FAM167B-like [Haliotis rubra]XP_046547448.1 protein FAM167B-like [Haliotis rubra]XP_046547449.1 protein FAM167B-like [Haliotis rubra]XP_046547450.1 protein FAM167B-like [Haliotis rubra]XP_046547451.1 protein FAM167B-like [Haliotis rubra]XP_046547452.1 protein FAM167B-like [Haliotis rubra]
MAVMGSRKKSTVVPPCYSQLGVIAEDPDDVTLRRKHFRYDVIPETHEPSDLVQVVETANRLNLRTQRASITAWKAQYGGPPRLPELHEEADGGEDAKLTTERKRKINQALDWIRTELLELRRQDQSLARQLLGIRRDISHLRLSRSCEEHEDMLEDAQIGMEEFHELSRVLDIPYEGPTSPGPLKQLGVTKMNISIRRFSTC